MDDNNIVGYVPNGLVPKTFTKADFHIEGCLDPMEVSFSVKEEVK